MTREGACDGLCDNKISDIKDFCSRKSIILEKISFFSTGVRSIKCYSRNKHPCINAHDCALRNSAKICFVKNANVDAIACFGDWLNQKEPGL